MESMDLWFSKSLLERKNISEQLILNYKDRFPVILIQKEYNLPPFFDKTRFLTPSTNTFAEFILGIRKYTTINEQESLYFFVNDKILIPSSETMLNIYNSHKSDDGFLYIHYSKENTFGY